MRIDLAVTAAGMAAAAATAAKTILLTNDDSWASTNIRASYRDLKAAGYDVIMVAPVSQRSGWGGKFDIPETVNLLNDGEFGYVKAGSPSWGKEEDDSNIWYFNGTPSSCVSFALDYVLPTYYDNKTIDLVVGGPNEGPNLSSGFYTASGTMSAVYYALYRGIPAISFSGSNLNNSFFKDSLSDDPDNVSNIYSKKVVELVEFMFNHSDSADTAVLPPLTGINVNFPQNTSCSDPAWKSTRLNKGGVFSQNMAYNETSKLMAWKATYYQNIEKNCTIGDCSLPSEFEVYLANDCHTSVSVFSADYDAPLDVTNDVSKLYGDLF